jgi:hypothetical protein
VPIGTPREAEDQEASIREARIHHPRDREAEEG